MKGLPSIEALESVHDFPTSFVFKVFGACEPTLEAELVELTRSVIADGAALSSRTRQSSKGKHACVTLTVEVRSAQMVHRVYESLSGHKWVNFMM